MTYEAASHSQSNSQSVSWVFKINNASLCIGRSYSKFYTIFYAEIFAHCSLSLWHTHTRTQTRVRMKRGTIKRRWKMKWTAERCLLVDLNSCHKSSQFVLFGIHSYKTKFTVQCSLVHHYRSYKWCNTFKMFITVFRYFGSCFWFHLHQMLQMHNAFGIQNCYPRPLQIRLLIHCIWISFSLNFIRSNAVDTLKIV